MPRQILLTGFPGFIASRLIPAVLEDDPEARIVALVEPRMEARARELAPSLGGDRLRIQPGDITQRRLGLDDAAWDRLTAETTEVHHLAAVYDLAVPIAIAQRVNVLGTEHIVDLCRSCPSLERHLYVSTAYVAGWRGGVVKEDQLTCGQSFKNHYESTKFAAEVVVRNSIEFDGVPTTIVRPAIVVGDSRTGETQKFDGPYYMLRTIAATKGPLPQIGNREARFNVVPVDFVVDAMVTAARAPDALGKTLHLTDPEPLPSAEVFSTLAREYDGRTPRFQMPLTLLDRSLRLGAVRKLYGGTPRESIQYLNHPVRFDVTNASEVLASKGLRCPRFTEYAPTLVRFFKEHEDDEAYQPQR